MAGWMDWITKNQGIISTVANVGMAFLGNKQAESRAQVFQQAAQAPQVDPFGSANRAFYQQKLQGLYTDPSSLENLPGYKFAQAQGQKSVNREAAKTGHYISTNRLHDIADYTTGLAEQTYGAEADRLARLSGAQMAPNANAFKGLTTEAQTAKAGGQMQIGKGIEYGLQGLGSLLSNKAPVPGANKAPPAGVRGGVAHPGARPVSPARPQSQPATPMAPSPAMPGLTKKRWE